MEENTQVGHSISQQGSLRFATQKSKRAKFLYKNYYLLLFIFLHDLWKVLPKKIQHSYQNSYLHIVPPTLHSITLAARDCLITIAVSDYLQFRNLWGCLFEFNYTCSNCWFTIVLINCLFTIHKSVVFSMFHIQPTLTESIKLPQDHLV